ncbi:MAG: hypothetical protein KGD73_03945 [Candidatus Lokiarchaeota archaeon]|nr:hypothetical protein [Candidatus Lokiarchaeota archaeon]
MPKDLKDLIEKVEVEQESRAYLEKTIDSLQAEVASLKNKLDGQKPTFKIKPVRRADEHDESEEISILKSMTTALRQESEQKSKENEVLQEQLQALKTEFVKLRNELFDSAKDEIIIKTQNSLNTLIQDYGKLESDNKSLKKKISDLQEEIEQHSKLATDLQSESFNKEQLEKQVGNFKAKIYELESNNQSLIRELKNLQAQGDSSNLEQMLEQIKLNNLELENENNNLAQKLESLKREKLKVHKYESEISDLKAQIDHLKEANKEIKDKDSILLAKTITAISSHDRKELSKPSFEPSSHIEEKPITILKEEEFIEKEVPHEPKFEDIPQSEIINEIKEVEKIPEETEDGSITRKWQCPQCGNTNKAQIREQDDKTRVIYSYPRMYAKKYVCGQCSKEWR